MVKFTMKSRILTLACGKYDAFMKISYESDTEGHIRKINLLHTCLHTANYWVQFADYFKSFSSNDNESIITNIIICFAPL